MARSAGILAAALLACLAATVVSGLYLRDESYYSVVSALISLHLVGASCHWLLGCTSFSMLPPCTHALVMHAR